VSPPPRRRACAPNWPARLALLAFAAYAVWASTRLSLTSERLPVSLGEGERLLARMFPPNFARGELLLEGLVESLQIAVLASAVGILLSLPMAC